MNKILLIISREYLVRVKKKSFLVLTFLVPMLIAAMYGLVGYLIVNQNKLATAKKVLVMDVSGIFKKSLKNSTTINFISSPSNDFEEAKKDFKKKNVDFILYIPQIKDPAIAAMNGESISPSGIQLIGEKEASIQVLGDINDKLESAVKNQSYLAAGIDTAKMNHIKADIHISSSILTDEGEKKSNSFSSFGLGIFASILIYMFIFLYGVQVMRGVMEEKTSRVVEVIISSVKPFQLMMGKIIGVALVGLTQFLLWILLTVVLSPIISNTFKGTDSGVKTSRVVKSTNPSKTSSASNSSETKSALTQIYDALGTQNYPYLIGCFLFYFLTGYLLYSALFAAVGAAVDSETETQQFMFPISLPLVFSIIISSNYVINNPDSSLSVWLSMIPLFSPVVMMVRIPFHPPLWQLITSMLLMILGFLGTTWIAAKIYRTGILLYGKKITFAEIGKWLFYKV